MKKRKTIEEYEKELALNWKTWNCKLKLPSDEELDHLAAMTEGDILQIPAEFSFTGPAEYVNKKLFQRALDKFVSRAIENAEA